MLPVANGARTGQRRNPVVAVLLSGVFPGLGQLYNRQWLKAVLFLAGGAAALKLLLLFAGGAELALEALNSVDPDIALENLTGELRKVLLASLPLLAIALWSVFDAYRTARRSRK